MTSNQGTCSPPRSQELVGPSVFTILLQQMFDFHSAKDTVESTTRNTCPLFSPNSKCSSKAEVKRTTFIFTSMEFGEISATRYLKLHCSQVHVGPVVEGSEVSRIYKDERTSRHAHIVIFIIVSNSAFHSWVRILILHPTTPLASLGSFFLLAEIKLFLLG